MSLGGDVLHGFRVLGKRLSFTVAAVFVLALGIGATTTVVSAVDALLLRPLPYRDPDRLVAIWEVNHALAQSQSDVSPVQFVDFRGLSSFESVAGWWYPDLNLTGHDRDPERIRAADVTDDFFSVVGVDPVLGRAFVPGEDRRGAEPVVVIGYELWTRRYGADPELVGRTILLDGVEHTVVGVAPRGFRYPRRTEVWRPLGWDPALHNRGARFFQVVARLRGGKTLEDAQTELSVLTSRLAREFPGTNDGWTASVTPLLHSELGRTRQGLLVLLAAVGLVLLLACANVANLLLAEAMGREEEIAIRKALGASRARLLKQLLGESLALSLVGGAAGLALAVYGVSALKHIVPGVVPRIENVTVDSRVVLSTVGIVVATALLFGSLPAMLASKGAPRGHRSTGRRTRDIFVVAQVAVAVLLVTGGGLLVRSFERLVSEDPGFAERSAMTFNLQLPASRYPEWSGVTDFYGRVVESLSHLPEIRGVAVTAFLPLEPGWRIPFTIDGRPPVPEAERPNAQHHIVSPGYFEALGIPLLRGRDFLDRDRSDRPGVVIINETARKRFWADEAAVGSRVLTMARQIGPLGRVLVESLEMEVVGVVSDVKNASLEAEPEPAFYFSFRQFAYRSMNVIVRSDRDPGALSRALESAVWRLDPELPVATMRRLASDLDEAVAAQRFVMIVLTVFAGLALMLAAVGTYGILSLAAGERRREIAIRIALGARPQSVKRALLGRGLALAGTGVGLGVLAAWALGSSLESFLFEVSAHDPTVFVVSPLVLVATALAASYLPARRASRTDPWASLRSE